MKTYDLVIIGAGSGGLAAARVAADLGARVAIVERNKRLGGECLHTGCVPSKALLYVARQVYMARQAAAFGLQVTNPVDYRKVMKYLQATIRAIEKRSDNPEYVRSKGIEVIHGNARLSGEREVLINEKVAIRARKIIIATGSQPSVPPIKGIGDVKAYTNETIFSLDTLPAKLAIIGAGSVGLEMATAFAMLGSRVSIFESQPTLLPDLDKAISARVKKSLDDLGVSLYLNSNVMELSKTPHQTKIVAQYNQKPLNVLVDVLLVATGREPHIDLGLDNAGVVSGPDGIQVNKYFQTENSHIYAVGDVTPFPRFTHIAVQSASVAVQHALLGFARHTRHVKSSPQWAMFTVPEVAQVGECHSASKQQVRVSYSQNDKAIADSQDGQIIVYTKNKKIIGAQIVGHQASEIIHVFSAAISNKNKLQDLSRFDLIYPTLSYSALELGYGAAVRHTIRPWRRLIALLMKIRR